MNVQLASGEVKTLSGKVRQRLIRPIETVYESDWHTWKFWRNAFLIYWIFSFIGPHLRADLGEFAAASRQAAYECIAAIGGGGAVRLWCANADLGGSPANKKQQG